MRQALVAGNWKMNGSKASIAELLNGIQAGLDGAENAEVAVCAPYIYIPMVAEAINGSGVAFGAQNISTETSGAFTGEISGGMISDFGCKYVIVGHSERRSLYGESDEVVAEKYAVALEAGLTPILCVGELLEEREAGETEAVVARQMAAAIKRNGVAALAKGVVAYEPVWAIGTGKTATPEQAQEVHAFIRGLVANEDASVAEGLRILYGGSMKPGNAAELIAQKDIDGGLIGGASLVAEDFLAICRAAN